mmetsp:Transcript_38335/g.118469  ORF Transcript_38335/g.118469 Transcript_38335/m.118469 type:complete len:314 (+) Transcript_38335:1261-2202(+)
MSASRAALKLSCLRADVYRAELLSSRSMSICAYSSTGMVHRVCSRPRSVPERLSCDRAMRAHSVYSALFALNASCARLRPKPNLKSARATSSPYDAWDPSRCSTSMMAFNSRRIHVRTRRADGPESVRLCSYCAMSDLHLAPRSAMDMARSSCGDVALPTAMRLPKPTAAAVPMACSRSSASTARRPSWPMRCTSARNSSCRGASTLPRRNGEMTLCTKLLMWFLSDSPSAARCSTRARSWFHTGWMFGWHAVTCSLRKSAVASDSSVAGSSGSFLNADAIAAGVWRATSVGSVPSACMPIRWMRNWIPSGRR